MGPRSKVQTPDAGKRGPVKRTRDGGPVRGTRERGPVASAWPSIAPTRSTPRPLRRVGLVQNMGPVNPLPLSINSCIPLIPNATFSAALERRNAVLEHGSDTGFKRSGRVVAEFSGSLDRATAVQRGL